MIEDFFRATDFEEALKIRAEWGHECYPLVGGTDLLVKIRDGVWTPRAILDLSRIPGFNKIEQEGGDLVFAAGATATDCLEYPFIYENFPALYKSCAWLGGPQIQNAGCLGGNIATGSPAADTVPCLMAAGGRVKLSSVDGSRWVPLDEMFLGPGKTALDGKELIEEIRVPLENLGKDPRPVVGGSKAAKLHTITHHEPFNGSSPDKWYSNDFFKAGPRLAQVISVVAMAGWAEMSGARTVKKLRLAFACAGPTCMEGKNAAETVEGKELTGELIEQAARAVQEDIKPISDVRGTAEYKRMLCSNYLRLFLQDLAGIKQSGTRAAKETIAKT